jgi:hypothetical protein
MSAIGLKLRRLSDNIVAFSCPACKTMHQVWLDRWKWNGSGDAPTFSPSINVQTGHFVDPSGQWCDKSGGTDECDCLTCHTFVRDGKIQYLNDCTHELAGQTVDLPDINTHETIQD